MLHGLFRNGSLRKATPLHKNGFQHDDDASSAHNTAVVVLLNTIPNIDSSININSIIVENKEKYLV